MGQFNYVNWGELSPRLICVLTGVDASTARRYKRQRRAPEPVLRLLLLHLNGHILPPSWHRLARFQGDHLILENVDSYSLGDFREQFWIAQSLRAQLTSTTRRLERLTALEPQPAPAQAKPLQAVAPKPAPVVEVKRNELFMRRFVR